MACEWGYFWLPKSGLSMWLSYWMRNEAWFWQLGPRSRARLLFPPSHFASFTTVLTFIFRFAPVWSTNEWYSSQNLILTGLIQRMIFLYKFLFSGKKTFPRTFSQQSSRSSDWIGLYDLTLVVMKLEKQYSTSKVGGRLCHQEALSWGFGSHSTWHRCIISLEQPFKVEGILHTHTLSLFPVFFFF